VIDVSRSWFKSKKPKSRPPLLKLLATALLFAASAASVPSQVLNPKTSQTPRRLPLSKFYDTPDPFPAGQPGELIRSEPFYEYLLPYTISAVRILYHSRSAHDKDIAASGVVLLPRGTAPTGGWPIIAWAHDLTGSARQCAPSLLKTLNEGPLLSMYVGLGYAVVASDYAGLGSNFPYAVLDVPSDAQDVINSVAAARAALPQLGSKWLVAGYAHGSRVAVGVAEALPKNADSNYLGAIGILGVADPPEFFEHLVQEPSYPMLAFLAQGIKNQYAGFRVDDMLTDKGVALYKNLGDSCEATSGQVPNATELLKPGWQNNPYVKEFFSRNALGRKPAFSPLLLISGETDGDVPSSLTAAIVGRLCQQKDRVLFVNYPGLNPSAVLGNSVGEQVSWIRARFSGQPAPSNCH
jgi:pimeloyl-ACP methyl ester carboxylesterase